ncbi:MAG TPA: NAD(P)/FAD-dependent oxidoreductase, partial [Steroidobacteraceae bacterium]|nr:NAD(P)/FAD-dependent oxidoreductase [Steroidobacteraceae bacterium]
MWDTIVLGSGIGGLTAAAALARCGQRVLVLEQHSVAGGLTQTFQRHDWSFATGVHYVSGVGSGPGADGQLGRILRWLTDGSLQFASCGNPYDIVRLPGFEFGIEHPRAAFRKALDARFPAQPAAIQEWFDQLDAASQSARSLLVMRGLPTWCAWVWRLWRGAEVRRFSEQTLAEALTAIDDPQLRAVLGARWGDYGAAPQSAPLLEHALISAAYDSGAYYPVGGPARFAQTLLPVIEAAGGQVRLDADVKQIVLTHGLASAVAFEQHGTQHTEQGARIISAMGVTNTVACLDAQVAPTWHASVHAMRPGLSYLALYLGFDGDIAAAGATAANVWIYESEDIGRVWQAPADEDAPGLFVSFPSLKDPANHGKHTAEVLALCDAQAFAPWLHVADGERPKAYVTLKHRIEERLLAQFRRHFPALVPMLRFHELSTPVTQRHFVRSPDGAMYGIEISARRLGSDALDVRTPVPGLLLAGQDVSGPGIQAACMSG